MQKFTDCIEPNYGHINQDGYVRVMNKHRTEGGKLKMKHRLAWEEECGPIPEGYEINHLCKNRKCYNLDHLECLTISEHRSKDNAIRYKDRTDKIITYSLENPNTQQWRVGEIFGVSQGCVSRTMIKYNKEK